MERRKRISGVISESECPNSTSERAADTLQQLVFSERMRAPRFGGTHGTCLALDATAAGRTKEQSPP